MSAPKRLRVELGTVGCWASVRGRDAYPLLQAVGARPIWSHLSTAWMTSLRRGRDVVALAERRGYLVEVTESDRATAAVTLPVPEPDEDVERDLFGQVIA